MMTIAEYQAWIGRTVSDNQDVTEKPKYCDEKNVIYYMLGLAGKVGEIVKKIKKFFSRV